MSRILDFDKTTGIKELFSKDGVTGKFSIKKEQDVSSIFSANEAEKNKIGNGSWKGDMHKVASIPLIIAEQWSNELKAIGANNPSPFHLDNRAFLIAKLNDYNYSKLRTKQGRL